MLLLVMSVLGTLFVIPEFQNVFDKLETKVTLYTIILRFIDFVDKVI